MVDPKIGETVLDPSCGSCSFLAEAANYMVKREKVDMATAFTNLYGVELESNIYAEGVMNMFINFGIMPNMKENIIEKDALIHLLTDPTTYSKIIANPPFGADAKDFKEWYFKTIMVPTKAGSSKMKKKIVENPEAHFKLPFPNTNESAILFFQLIILKLKEEGKAGVVMSATILNDGFKDMMEWFLNCCSLEKIVINPAGTFKEQGTGIETFSFIFTKGKPTKTVEIVMLGAENDVVRTLTLDQIKEAGWKLKLKEEEKKVENQAFCYDEIKNLFVYEHGTIAASTAIPGDFPFMTLDDTATHSSFAYDGENLFISKIPSGTGSTFTPKFRYSNGKVHASSLMLRLIPKSERVSLKFFYYFWKLKPIDFLRSFYKGAANKSLDQDLFGSFRFPIPPLHIQQEIVTALDLIYNNAATAKAAATSVKSQMAAVVRSVGARGFERKKLGDVASGNNGKGLGMEETMGCSGSYPILSGGLNYCGTFGKFNRDENTISLSKSGSSSGYVKWNSEKFWASDCFTVHPLNTEILNNRFLYYTLSLQQENIYKTYQVGGTIPHCYWRDLESLQITLPPLPIQHEVLAILNEMEAELQTLEQMAAKAEQRAKFILDGYLTPAPPPVEAEPVVDPNSIAAFIEKHIVHEDGAEASFKDIVRKYKEWCITRPEHVLLKKSELVVALSLVLGDLENEKYKGVKLI
jgi:restriction endonuclease S subunit